MVEFFGVVLLSLSLSLFAPLSVSLWQRGVGKAP